MSHYQQQPSRQTQKAQGFKSGLSVQELKAITQLRLDAANKIEDKPVPQPAKSNVRSYQTANPFQLAVAGMPIRSINANALPAQSNLAVGNQRNGNRGYNNQTHAVSNDPVYISNVDNSRHLGNNVDSRYSPASNLNYPNGFNTGNRSNVQNRLAPRPQELPPSTNYSNQNVKSSQHQQFQQFGNASFQLQDVFSSLSIQQQDNPVNRYVSPPRNRYSNVSSLNNKSYYDDVLSQSSLNPNAGVMSPLLPANAQPSIPGDSFYLGNSSINKSNYNNNIGNNMSMNGNTMLGSLNNNGFERSIQPQPSYQNALPSISQSINTNTFKSAGMASVSNNTLLNNNLNYMSLNGLNPRQMINENRIQDEFPMMSSPSYSIDSAVKYNKNPNNVFPDTLTSNHSLNLSNSQQTFYQTDYRGFNQASNVNQRNPGYHNTSHQQNVLSNAINSDPIFQYSDNSKFLSPIGNDNKFLSPIGNDNKFLSSIGNDNKVVKSPVENVANETAETLLNSSTFSPDDNANNSFLDDASKLSALRSLAQNSIYRGDEMFDVYPNHPRLSGQLLQVSGQLSGLLSGGADQLGKLPGHVSPLNQSNIPGYEYVALSGLPSALNTKPSSPSSKPPGLTRHSSLFESPSAMNTKPSSPNSKQHPPPGLTRHSSLFDTPSAMSTRPPSPNGTKPVKKNNLNMNGLNILNNPSVITRLEKVHDGWLTDNNYEMDIHPKYDSFSYESARVGSKESEDTYDSDREDFDYIL